MDLRPEHIAYKKKIGKLDGNVIAEIATTGGLHLVGVAKSGKFEVLGAGPHRAVARHLALKKQPNIQFSELAKGDWIEPEHFEHLLPEWEYVTQEIRKAQGHG